MSLAFAIGQVMPVPVAIEIETNISRTLHTTEKMIIRINKYLVYAFILANLISCSSHNSQNEDKIIRDNIYFSIYEYFTIHELLEYVDFDNIDEKGYICKDMFCFSEENCSHDSIFNNYRYKFLHEKYFIDPFLDGNCEVTVKYWREKRGEEYQTMFTIKGAPLLYQTDKKTYFLLIFAGPDKDIDNDDLPIEYQYKFYSWDSLTAKTIYGNVLNSHRHLYIPVHIDNNFIVYDPTNGIYSNGDIIWAYFKNEFDYWYKIDWKKYYFDNDLSIRSVNQ